MSQSNVPPSGPGTSAVETILVVEHEVLIRTPIASYLRECGYRVFEAVNLTEAKAVLGADLPVHLVFADVSQPGGENGFVLASWVRQNHPNTQVLLTTSLANATEKAGALCTTGPQLTKPYDHGVILQRIQGLLSRAGKTQA